MTLVIALCTSSAWAQSIVSVGTNLDFSEGTPVDNGICTYGKDMAGNNTTYYGELAVEGWTAQPQGTTDEKGYENSSLAGGLFAYGSGHWLGGTGYNVPAANPEGVAEGNALGAVAVWSGTVQYVQAVTLEAGDYVISIPVYNAKGGTTAPTKSLIGFIADNGTEYLAPAKAYAVNTWTVENIKFTLTETTTGKLSLGYAAPGSGSGANQHLFFDKVEVFAVTEADLARIELNAALVAAQATVDAKAGVGAGLFMYSEEAYNAYAAAVAAAVAAAKAVSENAEADKAALVDALAALNAATEAYVVTAPAADAVYAVKFNGTENYLTIGESTITIDAAVDTLSFEAVGNGKYYVHDNVGKYLSYAGNNKWTMTASADVKDEWTVSVNAEGLYTLTGKNGGIGVDGTEAGATCYGDKNGAAVALWTIEEIVVEEEPSVDPNDYTSYIVNADLSTTEAWNTDGTKGISGGMVKVASESAFDFNQTIALPAGQYKMTAKAAYRYTGSEQEEYDAILAGTETHLVKLYAETASYKYEANVQNRYEGASETDYAAGNGSVTVNGKFVPNSSAAVQAWFNNGQYVNELVFNVQEDGQIKIGITRVGGIGGDYTNIGAWTLTRLGEAEADPKEEEPTPDTPTEPETPVAPALDGTYFSVATATSTLEYERWYLLKSQGRNAYINELGTELRMKGAGELAAINATDDNKGLFFKLGKGTAEGTYTIVSGNGNYFTIAGSSSAVSATAVDYIIGNVAEGVFYMQDPTSNVVADANAAGGTFVGWGTTVPTSAGGHNCYQFMEVEFIDAAAAEAIVKASSMLYDLQVAYGLVNDASKFSSNAPETSEGSLAALIDNNYGTFFHSAWSYNVEGAHHLQMEVSEPTESIFFYFKKRSQNNNNRPTDITIFGSNDGDAFTEITTINSGFPTEAAVLDYTSEIITASEAYKHFRFVVNATSNNTAFFTFSEFYLFPGNQTIIDAIATSKALVEAGIGAENFDELKASFEVAYNKVQEDKFNKVFNSAVANAEAILAAASHAENPALGQYTSAAYVEFEAALATLKSEATQENLDAINAAVVKFEATKCLPVFTINGVIDYAAGMSIYENAEGGLNFKTTDLTDETMLWAFDMAENVVGVTEKVVVKNLATGNLFWGANSIKVTETSEAVAEDGIFLFYTEGNGTEVHAQKNGQAVVRWGDKAATSGSAWTFTYVGTTYDLYDLDAPDWADVTGQYIANADFSTADGWTGANINTTARVSEFYAGWGDLELTSGTLQQEVTLPAGQYRLTAKAFFRQGVSSFTDPAKSLGYIFAGDNKVLVKTLGGVEGLNSYADNQDQAGAAFYNEGLYDNVLVFTLTEETTLNIGFETTFDLKQSWFIAGEVKLESAQPIPGALVPIFEAQAMEFCSYSSMAIYALPALSAKWEALSTKVNEIYGAIYAGQKVLDASVLAVMDEMTAMMDEVAAIEKVYATYGDAKWAAYDIQDNSVANSDEVKAVFDAVVDYISDVATVTSVAELQALVDTLESARQVYVLNAVPTNGFTFDYTFKVGTSKADWNCTGNEVIIDGIRMPENFQETSTELGDVLWQTVTGLQNGQYTVELWANARVAWRESAATDGQEELTYLFANNIEKSMQVLLNPGLDSNASHVLEGVEVTDGTLKMGMTKKAAGSNWHTIQIKSLSYVGALPEMEPVVLNVVGAKVGDVEIVDGAATVESISTFDITFDRPVALAENEEPLWATLTDKWGDTSLKAEVLEENNCVVRFSLQWDVFTDAGDYYLYVPEGIVVGAEDANYINAAIEAVITIVGSDNPETPLALVNVTVGEDVMADLSSIVASPEDMIKVNYDGQFYYQGTPIIVDAEGNDASEYFQFVSGLDFDGSNSYIFMAQNWEGAAAPAGTYTITLAKASFLEMMSWKAPAEDIVLTVKILPTGIEYVEADAEAVIYDLSGRRVTKMTRGIYIVNGKKVYVK